MPVFESKRIIQEFGSSLAMTVPAFFVKANEVEKGSVMKVYYALDGVLIVTKDNQLEEVRESLEKIIERIDEKNPSASK